ncbi:hypothetical protein GQX74_010329 [Glossina fuscipes]|nr:hypothetical protein GQX74_010329 [Glossina fuscipes]
MTFENKFVCTYCEPLMWLFLILVCQPDFWLHIDIDPRHFDGYPVRPDFHHQPNVCVLTIPSLKFGHSSSTIPPVRGYHGVQRIPKEEESEEEEEEGKEFVARHLCSNLTSNLRNILAPPLVYISNNRSYRVNLVHEDFNDQRQASQAAMKSNLHNAKQANNERDLYGEQHNDEIDDDLSDIECQNSIFKLKIHVASSFYGGLIGFKGKIRNAVATAKHKIDVLVASLRGRMNATHFYGVALNYDEILENFQVFKELILSAQLPSIDESLFQLDSSLHATLGACVFVDDVERNKAATILQSCREFLANVKTPFKVHVRGLEIMNDDPSAVRVLYAIVLLRVDL